MDRRLIKKGAVVLVFLCLINFAVFAGFSGKINSSFNYSIDDSKYGFSLNNSSAKVSFDLFGSTLIGKADSQIKAEVKAYFGLWLNKEGSLNYNKNTISFSGSDIKGELRFDYAKIFGPGWELSLLGIPDVPDYAKSTIDTYRNVDGNIENASATRHFNTNAPGLSLKYKENQVGFGIIGEKDKVNVTVYLESQRFSFDNGLMFRLATYGNTNTALGKTNTPSLGFAGKFGYYGSLLKLFVASDVSLRFSNDWKKCDIAADVMLNTWVGGFGLEAYFANEATLPGYGKILYLLSARGTYNFDENVIPVQIGFTIKDILAKQDMTVNVGYVMNENHLFNIYGGYTIAENGRAGDKIQGFNSEYPRIGAWNVGFDFIYDNPSFMSAEIGMKMKQTVGEGLILSMNAGVSSKAIIPNAELALVYNADDLLRSDDSKTSNGDLGTISAKCLVAF